jgi:23S rRNA (uracil1939-C5)-methyltransferase
MARGMTRVTIQSLGQRGEGVAEIDGAKVYVPFALPGEDVEIDVTGDHGVVREMFREDAARAAPICPHFTMCGGCQLQHLPAAQYAAFKRGLVITALSFQGIEADVAPLVDARGAGRRRATLHARREGVGYMVQRSHDLYAIDTCPILVPALAKVPEIAHAIWQSVGDCDVSATATLTGLDIGVRTEKRAPVSRLMPFAQKQRGLARLALNGEMVLQNAPPAVRMGKATVELPIGSFLQATEAAEATLAALVVEGLAGRKAVTDLFGGAGPFALRLAESARVAAYDSDKPAIASLEKAVRNTQGLNPVTAKARDLFRDPLAAVELKDFDGAVFDPPRAGSEAQATELAQSKLKTIVGVSCEPKTFARDAKILIDGGYTLERVTPVDQFAYSTHVEIVGVFRR